MSSAADLFQHFENAVWIWWCPVVALSLAGLFYMAQLSAPQTMSGSIARIFMLVGFVCMISAFVYSLAGAAHNGLTRVGVLFLMASAVMIVRQFALACKKERLTREPDPSFGKRVLATLVDEHRGRNV